MPLVLWTTLLRLGHFWRVAEAGGNTEGVFRGIASTRDKRQQESVPFPVYFGAPMVTLKEPRLWERRYNEAMDEKQA